MTTTTRTRCRWRDRPVLRAWLRSLVASTLALLAWLPVLWLSRPPGAGVEDYGWAAMWLVIAVATWVSVTAVTTTAELRRRGGGHPVATGWATVPVALGLVSWTMGTWTMVAALPVVVPVAYGLVNGLARLWPAARDRAGPVRGAARLRSPR